MNLCERRGFLLHLPFESMKQPAFAIWRLHLAAKPVLKKNATIHLLSCQMQALLYAFCKVQISILQIPYLPFDE
jgi:hypothetical protein